MFQNKHGGPVECHPCIQVWVTGLISRSQWSWKGQTESCTFLVNVHSNLISFRLCMMIAYVSMMTCKTLLVNVLRIHLRYDAVGWFSDTVWERSERGFKLCMTLGYIWFFFMTVLKTSACSPDHGRVQRWNNLIFFFGCVNWVISLVNCRYPYDFVTGKVQEEVSFRPIREPAAEKIVDISEHLDQLPPAIKDLAMELQSETLVQWKTL